MTSPHLKYRATNGSQKRCNINRRPHILPPVGAEASEDFRLGSYLSQIQIEWVSWSSMPRFILFIRADEDSESGKMPPREAIEAMTSFWKELVAANVLVYGDGMHASSKSTRIIFPGNGVSPMLKSGPFPVNEVVAGFWILDVKDYDEALVWAKKCPVIDAPQGCTLELRQFITMEDARDSFTDEMREEHAKGRKLLDDKLGFQKPTSD
ncbi:hypothetical protein TWF192_005320 [Orbilia oligospora]|nr:hypothetical protein TWF192_005320 [Orbilia oligospora]